MLHHSLIGPSLRTVLSFCIFGGILVQRCTGMSVLVNFKSQPLGVRGGMAQLPAAWLNTLHARCWVPLATFSERTAPWHKLSEHKLSSERPKLWQAPCQSVKCYRIILCQWLRLMRWLCLVYYYRLSYYKRFQMFQNPFSWLFVNVQAENLHKKPCSKLLSLSEQLLFVVCLYLIHFPWINWRSKE